MSMTGVIRKISHNNVSFSLKIYPCLRKKNLDNVIFGLVQCDQMRCPLRHENPQQDMVDVYHSALTWRSRRVLKLETRKEFKSTIVKERPDNLVWEVMTCLCSSRMSNKGRGQPVKQYVTYLAWLLVGRYDFDDFEALRQMVASSTYSFITCLHIASQHRPLQ